MMAAMLAYLLNAAWQAPLVALGASLLNRNARLTPGWRCRLGVGLLASAVILPALQLAPALRASGPHALAIQAAGSRNPADLAGLAKSGWSALASRSSFAVEPGLASVLIVIPVLLSLLAAVRLVRGLVSARAMVVRSAPFPNPPIAADKLEALVRGGVVRPGGVRPEIRLSYEVHGPVVIGVTRPVILTPMGFERLGEDEVCAALLHECAHVARRDYAMNLLCELLSLPLTWHPAVHVLKSGVRSARELACDALASAQMGSSLGYARSLVALAQTIGRSQPPTPTAGLALMGQGDLEMRVRALLRPRTGGLRVRDLIVTAGVLGLVVAPVAALHLSPRLERPVEDRGAPAPARADPPMAAASSPVRRIPAFSRPLPDRLAAQAAPDRSRMTHARRSSGPRREEEVRLASASPRPPTRSAAGLISAQDTAAKIPDQLGDAAPAAGDWIAARPVQDGLASASVVVRLGPSCSTGGRLVLVRLVLATRMQPVGAVAAPASAGPASSTGLIAAVSDHRLGDIRPAPWADRSVQQDAAAASPGPLCRGATTPAPAPRPT